MFKTDLIIGQNKKNKLVLDLVSACKMKQAEVLYILKTRQQHLKEEQIKEKVSHLFT